MFRNGQSILLYLGEDRQLYIDHSPGKHVCVFEGRYFIQPTHNIISIITPLPIKYDGGPVHGPPNTKIQGLEDIQTNAIFSSPKTDDQQPK